MSVEKTGSVKRALAGRGLALWGLVLLFFFAAFLLSLALGPANLSPARVLSYIFGGSTQGDVGSVIFWQIRMPRVLLTLLVGAALALAGVIMQGLFLNPLTDPYVTGVSSGAALGATLAFFFKLPAVPWTSLFAIAAGLLTIFTVYGLSRRRGVLNIYQLLLNGVTFSFFCFALATVLMIKSGRDMHAVVYWLLGSFSGRGWREVMMALPILPFLMVPFFFSAELDILLQGEERALEMGVEVERVKTVLFFVAALLTALAVSVSGIIGFVGLVVPHICRMLAGPGHRRLLLMSIFVGAGVMAVSDLIARMAFAPSEVPVGIVTIFFGAPFFIYLLRKRAA